MRLVCLMPLFDAGLSAGYDLLRTPPLDSELLMGGGTLFSLWVPDPLLVAGAPASYMFVELIFGDVTLGLWCGLDEIGTG